jgi:hypothetical protein
MREIIRRHNRLNGVLFSIAEFSFIALLIGAFATYYLFHRRPVMAFVAWGIALNSAAVVYYGLRQLAHDRAHGKPIGSYWDRASREQHRRENPHMLRDTLGFTITALLPFVMILAVVFDLPRHHNP